VRVSEKERARQSLDSFVGGREQEEVKVKLPLCTT